MITFMQWYKIHDLLLGLRSEDNATEIKSAASYAMNCGARPLSPVPANWTALLEGTIQTIKAFPGSEARFLMIISKSNGSGAEYDGCFPKCSVRPTEIHAVTSLNNTVDNLTTWVEANIPSD
jgi:hypothetical protein